VQLAAAKSLGSFRAEEELSEVAEIFAEHVVQSLESIKAQQRQAVTRKPGDWI